MSTLTIHFRERFSNEPVEVWLDGRQRFAHDGITTKLLVGYAELVPLEVSTATVEVEIVLPQRSLRRSVTISVERDMDLEVWLDGNQLELRRPPTPPAYL
jgi:hypothetical protein